MPAKKSKNEEAKVEANLLPVMNIMFLLIPALLLAMEFASMASIHVSPPRTTAMPTNTEKINTEKNLNFKVTIRGDGFRLDARAGKVKENGALSEIPLLSAAGDDSHDYLALAEQARQLKNGHPDETQVTVTAEGDVPMETLVRTLDTLRGDGCRLAGVFEAGERAPDECLFWNPIVSSAG